MLGSFSLGPKIRATVDNSSAVGVNYSCKKLNMGYITKICITMMQNFKQDAYDETEFAAVPSYPQLKVSRDGRVVGPRGCLLKLQRIKGYPAVGVSAGPGSGAMKTVLVHKLVAEAYLGTPPPEAPCIDHIDGNRVNNHVDNLRYLSNAENLRNNVRTRTGQLYVGVYKRGKKYQAQFQDGKKSIYLGMFFTSEEAALRHDQERIARGMLAVNSDTLAKTV